MAHDRTRTSSGAQAFGPAFGPASGPALNWREIDRVLVELELTGTFIRDVAQAGPATLLFSLHRPAAPERGIGPGRLALLCRLAGGSRLHRTAEPFPSGRAPPSRFVTFLRAHVRNSRIDSALQLGTERIVRIRCGAAARRRIIWLRLWSGASNCVVTDDRGTILETLFRRPQRGETAGSRFAPPVQVGGGTPSATGCALWPAPATTTHAWTRTTAHGNGSHAPRATRTPPASGSSASAGGAPSASPDCAPPCVTRPTTRPCVRPARRSWPTPISSTDR